MPIEIPAGGARDAIARLGEHDVGASTDIEAALEWTVPREDDAWPDPLVLWRHELQLFLWYALPRKWLIPRREQERVARRLGAFIAEAASGELASAYAELCTAETTLDLIAAWNDEGQDAHRLLRAALEESGLDPPDTDSLEWSPVMGLKEASARDLLTRELEEAIEAGALDPAARGFARAQRDLVAARLGRAREDLEGSSLLARIVGERLDRWSRRGGETRSALVAPALPIIRGELAPASDAADPSEAEEGAEGSGELDGLVWLLRQAEEGGIALTQTGAINRALVRAAVARFPAWWDAEFRGSPQREDDVRALGVLHELARRLRLLRRRGRKLLLTKRGAELARDRSRLRAACAAGLLPSGGFPRAIGELQLAYLLTRERSDLDELEPEIHRAIVEEGWTADGEPPSERDVAWAGWELRTLAEALGLLTYEYEWNRSSLESRRELTPTAAGRPILAAALACAAAGPSELP